MTAWRIRAFLADAAESRPTVVLPTICALTRATIKAILAKIIIIILSLLLFITNLFPKPYPSSIHTCLHFSLPPCKLHSLHPPNTRSTSPNHLIRLSDPFLRLTRPLPATSATLASLSDRLHPRQLLHRRAQSTRKGPYHPLPHPTLSSILPLVVEGTHRTLSLAPRTSGDDHPAGISPHPLAHLLHARARAGRIVAPRRSHSAKRNRFSCRPVLLGFSLPSVLAVFTFSVFWNAFWKSFP